MRIAALALCTLLGIPVAALPQSQAIAGGPEYAKLRLIRVKAPAVERAATTQFLAADAKGHPLLLRGDSLEVFGLGPDAGFDRRIGQLTCDRSSGPVYAAAMDPVSLSWAVGLAGSAKEVDLCDFSEQTTPPEIGWVISSVTYSSSGPLVGVTCLGPRPGLTSGHEKSVPRVFGLQDGRWQPIAWAPVAESKEMPANPMDGMAEAKAMSDASYCAGPNGALWAASWNSYHLQKLSSSATPEHDIVVGSGEMAWHKLDKEEEGHEQRASAAAGANRLMVPSSSAGVPRGVVRALVCARDGYLYLVVSTPEGLALDRYNPSQSSLDRVMLDGATVSSGPMTVALTSDQLWLGGRLATDGIWRIPSEDLDTAHWKPVKNVKADGKPWG
jgi:hypothetical protein